MIHVNINPRRFTGFLLIVFFLFLVAHLAAVLLRYKVMPESNFVEKLDQFWNFDQEGNLPTYFNTMLLFLSAQSFLLIAFLGSHTKLYFKTYWYVLAIVFFLLSIDEFTRIHEGFNYYVPKFLGIGGSGIWKFAWIIPYGILAILFGLYSIKFLLSLERKFQIGYVVSGALYVMGAVGIEAIGGIIYESNSDSTSFEYIFFLLTLEESLEMLALILLLNYNLKFLLANQKGISEKTQ